MNIFEFAKKMEKDGEAFYRDLASNSTTKGLAGILGSLADAEARHYKVLVEMEKKQGPELSDSQILANAKNVFSGMKMDAFDPNFSFPQIDAYKKALDIEKKSEDFYREKAGEAENGQYRLLFLRIAEEEKQHYFLVDNIIEFMQRPFRWLEYAEWNHLDEY
jgi:rubrerythrin